MAIVATPLAGAYFTGFAALPSNLVGMAKVALWIALPMPALAVLQSWFQGAILSARRTRAVPESVVIFLATALVALGLGVILIYAILASQFRSFLQPFAIMLSLPLSLVGVAGMLYLAKDTLNIMSMIGVILLMGLVTKNAILLVDNANQRQSEGMNVRDAMITAGAARLRPILMTTGAMVLGAVPLALARGAGAESRAQIGWVIVGGMTLGTLLTLFVVPTMYSLLARRAVPGANMAPVREAAE